MKQIQILTPLHGGQYTKPEAMISVPNVPNKPSEAVREDSAFSSADLWREGFSQTPYFRSCPDLSLISPLPK